jgi:AcrR family transcriptional regulator
MTQEGRRRRPPEGGYARGEEKRIRIVEVALRIFGEQGYEGASTRQIAQEAGVNPPALQYYFESKEGLYLACIEHIRAVFSKALEPAYAAADAIGPDDPREAATAALCGIMGALADFLFDSVQVEGWSRFIARCEGEGDRSDYNNFKQVLKDTLHERCFRLVGLATGCPPSDPRTKLHTVAILGQLSVFHLGRDKALALLDWPDIRGERLALLKSVLRAHTEAILNRAPSIQ